MQHTYSAVQVEKSCFPYQAAFSEMTAVVALVLSLLPGAQAQEHNQWNVVKNLPMDQFRIQSHRGAGVLAPENTLEACELGWKLQTTPEIDVRTTKDGVIVAFHDDDFKRVVKGVSADLASKGVGDVTFDELSKLDVGAWKGDDFQGRRVSAVRDIFERMQGKPERQLYLDIKQVDFDQLAREVKSAGVDKQVIFATQDYAKVKKWKANVPDSQTLLWMHVDDVELAKALEPLRTASFAGITQVQVHITPKNGGDKAWPFTLSRECLTNLGYELRSHGIVYQALPYTPDPAIYGKLLDLGIDSFATDYPDVTWQKIRDYYEAHARGGG